NLHNLGDALTRRGGWHQESDGNPKLLRCLLQRPGLFRWQVGDNQAADAISRGGLAKSLDAKCQQRVIVAHQDQGDIAASRNLPGNLHTAVDCHSAFQREMSRVLNGRSVSEWVAEWHPQFDDICSPLYRGQHQFNTLRRRRISPHEIWNQHAAPLLLCSREGRGNLRGRDDVVRDGLHKISPWLSRKRRLCRDAKRWMLLIKYIRC